MTFVTIPKDLTKANRETLKKSIFKSLFLKTRYL